MACSPFFGDECLFFHKRGTDSINPHYYRRRTSLLEYIDGLHECSLDY